jgi:hypothetical protein
VKERVYLFRLHHADGDRVDQLVLEHVLERGVLLVGLGQCAGPEELHAEDDLAIGAGLLEHGRNLGGRQVHLGPFAHVVDAGQNDIGPGVSRRDFQGLLVVT